MCGTDVVVAERQNSAVSARTKTCADCAEEKSHDGATQAASALSAVRTLPASACGFIGCPNRLPKVMLSERRLMAKPLAAPPCDMRPASAE